MCGCAQPHLQDTRHDTDSKGVGLYELLASAC
jgi:hypothetical protein